MVVITDGEADDPDGLKDVIVEMAQRMDEARLPAFQLGVQFLQIGNDPAATEFLRTLDDDLKEEVGVRDFVDTTHFDEGAMGLSSEFLLKALLGSVNRSESPIARSRRMPLTIPLRWAGLDARA